MHNGFLRSRWTFLTATWPGNQARLFVVGVIAAHLVAAWCNAGFLNADEHYQIIEFAQYKLGHQGASALAWEFPARIRPALQPWLATVAIRADRLLGATSPFTIAFSLRLISAVLAMLASFELCVRCLRSISSVRARQAALFLSLLLWIGPTVHARFSSENWGGLWFAAGLCVLLDALDRWGADDGRPAALAACAGAAWSAAFYCRFQMGIAIAGAALWLLVIRRAPRALVSIVALTFAAGCVTNEILDRWLYGAWTLVPLNYVQENLVKGKAAAFGTAPWWMIAVYAAIVLIPPFSLALLAWLAAGSWRARRHLLVWTAVPFVLVHAVLARKDPRFLSPLLYLLGPWLAVCLEALRARLRTGIAVTFVAVDVLILCVTIVLPANDEIRLDRWLWDQSRHGVHTIYAVDPLDNRLPPNVTNSFYGSGIVVLPFTPPNVRDADVRMPVYVYYNRGEMPAELAARGCAPVLQSYPAWLVRIAWFKKLAHVTSRSICRLESGRA
jgi:phosphatidylinositol glycan class B